MSRSFYCVNDNTKIDLENAQIMHCILCYQKVCNMNKFENSNKEETNSLLQDKWNNSFFKTCGCKAHYYCKNVWRRNKIFVETKRRKTTNKEKNMVDQFPIFFCQKFFQKKRCAIERISRRLGLFDCQERITNAICGKYVVETFNFMFVSKIKFPFQKVVF